MDCGNEPRKASASFGHLMFVEKDNEHTQASEASDN